jgi:tRNA threonylcarbamoyladenosine biosynthesis protein TsaE
LVLTLQQHRIVTTCAEETLDFGFFLGRHLANGDLVALNGNLGSGKTCLTQGIAKGLDVPDGYYITSPSFALVNEYPGRIRLFHMDFYRMEDISDLDQIGFDDLLALDGVFVIEWAHKFLPALPKRRLDLFLTIVNETKRELSVNGYGHRAEDLVKVCAGYDLSDDHEN